MLTTTASSLYCRSLSDLQVWQRCLPKAWVLQVVPLEQGGPPPMREAGMWRYNAADQVSHKLEV